MLCDGRSPSGVKLVDGEPSPIMLCEERCSSRVKSFGERSDSPVAEHPRVKLVDNRCDQDYKYNVIH